MKILRACVWAAMATGFAVAMRPSLGAKGPAPIPGQTQSPTLLAAGTNVIAVEVHQGDVVNSDLSFDLQLVGIIDTTPPAVIALEPQAGSVVQDLSFVRVTFDDAVAGVDASDLLINDAPATNVVVVSSREYTFYFPQPPTGTVQVAWVTNHGITDVSPLANSFAGGSWNYTLDPHATPCIAVISEFMAANANGIADEDGTRADWIEIYNPGPLDLNLEGWCLSDEATNLTKWRFPALTLVANKYLLVWASGKDRANPATPLHTNFRLEKDGEFLALSDPAGNSVSAFAPAFPPQRTDTSYGRDRGDLSILGYYLTPTPGAPNALGGPGFAPDPVSSLESGVYTNNTLSLTISAPPPATIRYTLDGSLPGSNSPVYTGPMGFSNNVVIKARVFQDGVWPSRVLARSFIFLDASTRDFNSNLPVLILSTGGRSIAQNVPPGQPRTPGSIVALDTFQGRATLRNPPQFHGLAEFELFGQTAISFPKPPLTIEIQDELRKDLAVPLLGLPAEADWRLRNPYNDKTYLNDFLAPELHEQMGRYAVRRKFVEVFIDAGGGKLSYPGDYFGVFILLERIERSKNRINLAELTPSATNEPAITGGYMFKKDKDSVGDLNFATTGHHGFPAEALKIHEPKPNEFRTTPGVGLSFPGSGFTASASNQLNYLRSYLNRMETNLYANDWLTRTSTNHYSWYLDVDSFVDQHWIVEFAKSIDGYRLSTYFIKDRNGKVRMEPVWGWDRSFGNANYLQGGLTSQWYFARQSDGMTANEHIWLRRLINGNPNMGANDTLSPGGDPDFIQKIADRWSVLRTNILNATNVLARIDELSLMLSEAAARDLWGKYSNQIVGVYVWPNPNGPVGAWDVDYVNPRLYRGNETNSIIGQMKKWMLGRYLWIDGQFTPVPTLSHPGGEVAEGFTVVITGPAGATNYFTLDGTDPRLPGGAISPTAQSSVGPVTLLVTNNVRVVARARGPNKWYDSWSGPVAATWVTVIPSLRITEINYHPYPPPPGDPNDAENFEFIEVKNVGGTPLNVNRYRLSGGIEFVFPDVVLPPGRSAVVVKDVAAFQSRYGTNLLILGTFTGNLGNEGDHLVLEGSLRETIHDFNYSDQWYRLTDGTGFTLVVADETASLPNWGTRDGWRVSAALGGSPGVTDPTPPPRPAVVINEALTHDDPDPPPGLQDAIELYNPTDAPADIGGWFLTDDFNTPKKFRIPEQTLLAAGSYLVFTETDFNPNPGVFPSFALSARGEEVYLFSANREADLTGYAHGFAFGAQANGVTFGRYVTSTGDEHFVAQRSPTLGTNNAGPLVGPVVITEIMYHPPDIVVAGAGVDNTGDEFIELQNIGGNPAPLYDPTYPTNTWHLRNAVQYDFPATNVVIPAEGYLLLVSFNPGTNAAATAAFRARNFVPDTVPLYGPWRGQLTNAAAAVELRRPDRPDADGVPSILVERVEYSSAAPWLSTADGLGMSLQRIVPVDYGDDLTNWVAVAPTPGSAFVPGAVPPTILSQPASQLLVTGQNYVLSVTAAGTPPLQYQWRFNGLSLSGATNSTLAFTPFQITNAGTYNVLVYNGGGSALGTNFIITARVGLQFLQQPSNAFVRAGMTATFTVAAVGTGTLRYQWSLNGVNLAPSASYPGGVTGARLTVSNVQASVTGPYTVQVSDDYDTAVSQAATLALITPPAIVLQPLSQAVVEGGAASLSVACSGSPPISFRWRKQGITIAGLPHGYFVNSSTSSVLTITNVQLTNAGNYSVVASNLAGQAPVSSNAVLTVLADTDRDGLPDAWEADHPGFSPNDPGDGARDDDGDAMSNGAEWFAGTDYLDPASVLRIDRVPGSADTLLGFRARPNRTYSVLWRESVDTGFWTKLADILARPVDREETVLDLLPPAASRVYRVVIPVHPGSANPSPVILQSPETVIAEVGENPALEVIAFGQEPLAFEWTFNRERLPDAQGATLIISNATFAQAGLYAVTVIDLISRATSQPVALALRPLIVEQPHDRIARTGDEVIFQVSAVSTGPLSYLWFRNGWPLAEQTNAVLRLANVQRSDAGTYQVVATHDSPAGRVGTTSAKAILAVLEE